MQQTNKQTEKTYNEVSAHTSQTVHDQKVYKQYAGEAVEKTKPSYTDGSSVNWCSYYGEWYGGFLKT